MSKPKSEAAHGWVREECLQEEDSMSSPINPPQTIAQPAPPTGGTAIPSTPPTSSGPARRTGAPFALELAAALDTLPSSPPQEVLDQMAGAARTYEALSSQGRELRFARDEQSGRTRVEVRDRAGNVLKTISPAQALAVAAGAPLE
jgi:hypothetical protein